MVREMTEQSERLGALEQRVVEAGGVVTMEASEVRDAYGADRLGSIVRGHITDALRRRGIAHYPKEFPDRQWSPVRLYKLGGEVGQIIEAVLEPGGDGDQRLRRATGDSSAEAVLARIRELVCE